ncbi:hypothetical protein BC827DRAFT_1297083 [Russula dissimulans]|nr:hypothetical protein BC827DRAFT_1297083 [Russula dissimulans]
MDKLPSVTFQVLLSNEGGVESVHNLLAAHPDKSPIDEIAVFMAATDAFSLSNTDLTLTELLKHLVRIVGGALDKGQQGSWVHQSCDSVSVLWKARPPEHVGRT